ncbi:MAG: GTPase Era [Treponemataceae bacterium]
MNKQEKTKTRCGVVTIIGRPSAGKSTFLNTVCGGKVSIVSQVPQTTRNTIRGIVTKKEGQILFLDTPGLHESEKKFNEELRNVSVFALKDADAVLYLIDATRNIGSEEENIFQLLQENNVDSNLVIGINKIDEKKAQVGLIKLMVEKIFPQTSTANRVFEISAKKQINLEPVLDALIQLLPEAELMYPPDFYTDQDVAFRISEIIREKAIENTREEVPHAIYVKIEEMQMKRNGKELFVKAFICVERESQKGILIGKDARIIKKIKNESLKIFRQIFSYHIILSLQVRVDKDWRKNEKTISAITKR